MKISCFFNLSWSACIMKSPYFIEFISKKGFFMKSPHFLDFLLKGACILKSPYFLFYIEKCVYHETFKIYILLIYLEKCMYHENSWNSYWKMHFSWKVHIFLILSWKVHVFLEEAMPCCRPLIIGVILLHNWANNQTAVPDSSMEK